MDQQQHQHVLIPAHCIIRAAKELANDKHAPGYYAFDKYELHQTSKVTTPAPTSMGVDYGAPGSDRTVVREVERKGPWTKAQYLEFHEKACQKMIEVTKMKNADYTGGSGNPFANFEQAGNFVQIDQVTEIGFFTRMSDKFSRIGSFLTKGHLLVKDESVEDTLIDLANYCILFAGYLRSKKAASR